MRQKILLTMLLLLSLVAPFAALADSFYLKPADLEVDNTATLQFYLDNAMECYGFQAEITFPDGIKPVKAGDKYDVTLSDRASNGQYEVESNILKNGNFIVGAYSANQKPFTGNSGVLVDLKVSVANSFKGGTLKISNIMLIDKDDKDVALNSTEAKLGVVLTGVSFTRESIPLKVGGTTTLVPTFAPTSATDKTLTWESSDESVATVAPTENGGLVTAVREGETTITATASNGKKATCVVTVSSNVVEVTSIILDVTELNLTEGDTKKLVATVGPENATDKTVGWTSDDDSVVKVDKDGNVTAVGAGTATITAEAGDVKATCKVTVKAKFIAVTEVTLNNTSLSLTEGETSTLKATVTPENATEKNVTWTSSNTEVATVDATGKVTAIAAGDAIITATVGGKTVTCEVTVKAKVIAVVGVSIDKTTLSLTEGETATLKATVAPATATDKSVAWTSSNTAVATVDATGIVTAVAPGSATITVNASGKTATCEVTVKAKVIAVTGVTLDKTTLSLTEGETATIKATVAPDNATDKSVAWTSSNTAVATVDATGKVTAVAAGTANITATASGNTATCTMTVKAKTIAVTGVTLDKTTLSLTEGETATIKATVAPENATDKNVAWTSSNTAVATVDATGKVTAVTAGTANITATVSGKTASCTVTVKAKTIDVTGVTLSNTASELKVGETVTLTATVTPENATGKTVVWTSSNEAIATVDANGYVTAKAIGEATITAACGAVKATCKVTVIPTPVESIKLSNTTLALAEGDKATLTATIAPANATDKSVTWTSSNESVATVSEAGEVNAVKAGTAIITATSSNDKTAYCNVTVSANIISATGITISKTELDMTEGDKATLTATVTPDNATDKSVTWTSSDESIATVSDAGEVTAVSAGTATITAASSNGKTANCEVTVATKVIAVEGITLDKTALNLTEGETETLIATVAPENATDKTVTWTSSNTAVATVDANGKVTAVAAGEAIITAKSGDKDATCKVTVDAKVTAVEGITLDKTVLSLTEGETETLTATVTPENATDKTVTWTSSDAKVASIDENGVVTAVAAGTATITAKAGDKTATCVVTVTAKYVPVEGLAIWDEDEQPIDKDHTLALHTGDEYTLTEVVTPENATDQKVTWNSSDEAIAKIVDIAEEPHQVHIDAIAAGEATITASVGGFSCSFKVIVTDPVIPVTGIFLDKKTADMFTGETLQLNATIIPADASSKEIKWTSSDNNTATVSTKGLVTAKKAGKVTITASANKFNAICEITITDKVIPVESLVILDEDDQPLDKDHTLAIHTGDEYTLTEVVTPENATDQKVTWTSSDESIAKIVDIVEKPHQVHIDAIAAGEATITASVGGFSCSFKVTVTDPVIPVTGISLDKKTAEMLTGATLQLNATITPADASSKEIKWTSSDNNTATVSTKGLVTAKKAGKVIITASANKFTATCEITITDPVVDVAAVTLNMTEATMEIGESVRLTATVSPENATDKNVTWTSSNEEVAIVNQNGHVTAVGAGVTVITAMAGGKSAECKVTVSAPGIRLDITSADMMTGESLRLSFSIVGVDIPAKSVKWSSSDEDIAVVNPKGMVVAKRSGKVTITASAGDYRAACEITVKDPEVLSITLSKTEETIAVGETLKLFATIETEGKDATVTWTSSDESVATVDIDGLVTAVGVGNVTIVATAGDKTAECQLTVEEGSGVALIGFDSEAPVKVYDLNGRHIADDVKNLQGGFYIVRQGNKAKKIRVK